jgi:hypothetical protein
MHEGNIARGPRDREESQAYHHLLKQSRQLFLCIFRPSLLSFLLPTPVEKS